MLVTTSHQYPGGFHMFHSIYHAGQSWASITQGFNKWSVLRSTFSFLGYHIPFGNR